MKIFLLNTSLIVLAWRKPIRFIAILRPLKFKLQLVYSFFPVKPKSNGDATHMKETPPAVVGTKVVKSNDATVLISAKESADFKKNAVSISLCVRFLNLFN